MTRTKLSEKQRRFCEIFSANGGNATDAAREAGYAKPHPQGAENLQKPTIQRELEKMRLETTNQAIADREQRQIFLTRMMDDESQATRDRIRACELLGKAQGDFITRIEEVNKPVYGRPTPEELEEAKRHILAELDRAEPSEYVRVR